VKRGYPEDLVIAWLKKNISKRWETRLRDNTAHTAQEGVLVLKSSFNLAWNYFNATEFGEAITSYWKEWYDRADRGEYSLKNPKRLFPAPTGDLGGLDSTGSRFWSEFSNGSGDTVWLPDIRKISMLDRRFLVSRKRTRNMFDLTNLWKQDVFAKLDEKVSEELENIQAPQTQLTVVEPRLPGLDPNRLPVHIRHTQRRSSSPDRQRFL
jgi:hypothetical protein